MPPTRERTYAPEDPCLANLPQQAGGTGAPGLAGGGSPGRRTGGWLFTGGRFSWGGWFFTGSGSGPGGPSPSDDSAAAPVNARTGNFTHQDVDLTLPGRGLPLTWERSYNSLAATTGLSRPLGYGWTHNYALRLVPTAGLITLVAPRGSELPFYCSTADCNGGTFTPGPGVRATLVQAGDTYTVTRGDGLIYTFDRAQGYRLAGLADRFGNRTTLTYNAAGQLTRLTAASGRALTLTYTANGQLAQLLDPLNRATTYTYDAAGNLWTVARPGGEVITYTYTLSHQLRTISDTVGTFLINDYDTAGRVSTQRTGTGGMTTWVYASDHTVVTDSLGRTTRYTFTASGLPAAIQDPAGGVTTLEYDDQYNLTARTDPLGRTTRLTWDAACNPTATTDPLGQVTRLTYDGAHQLRSLTDARLSTTYFGYQGGALTAITRALSSGVLTQATFAYNAAGQVTASADALNHVTRYGYNSAGDLVVITNPQGYTTTLAYDPVGRLVAITNTRGATLTLAYDAGDRLLRQVDALGGTSTYEYGPAGLLSRVSDAHAHTTTLGYNAAGQLVTVTPALPSVPPTLYAYDPAGRVTAVTDGRGATTRLEYDTGGRVLTVTPPLSSVLPTRYTYDAAGQLTAVRGGDGQTTQLAYDRAGRLVTVTQALSRQIIYSYDPVGNVTRVREPNGDLTSFGYDEFNRPTVITDVHGRPTWLAYDAAGNLQSQLTPDLQLTRYTYDELNRLTTLQAPLAGVTQQYAYDPAGNLTALTTPNGAVTHYAYDALNRLTGVQGPGGGLTTYSYDAGGQLTARTDPLSHTTTYLYDALDRLLQVQGPLPAQTTTYGYDAVGNTTALTNAAGQVITLTYDPLQRLAGVQYPGGSTQFAYDGAGRRTVMTDTTGVTTYAYDALGRPLTITAPYSGSVSYRYDTGGRRTQARYAGQIVTYTYYSGTELAQVSWGVSQTYTYTYDTAGRVASLQRPNRRQTFYGYDAAGRLIQVEHTDWLTAVQRYAYTLDPAGQRVAVAERFLPLARVYLPVVLRNQGGGAASAPLRSAPLASPLPTPAAPAAWDSPLPTPTPVPVAESAPGARLAAAPLLSPVNPPPPPCITPAPVSNGQVLSYTYDAAQQLTAAAGSTGRCYQYEYAATGNRTALTVTHQAAVTLTTYTYDAADRLLSLRTGSQVISPTYDPRGNLTYDGVFTYTYDALGRLTRATGVTVTAVYTYNGDGLRVAQNLNGVETRFMWDQALEIPEVLSTTDGDLLLYGLDLLGLEHNGAWYYPQTDALGSLRQWTDANGMVIGQVSFDPFGGFLSQQGFTSPWGFAGEYHDPLTGLQYLRARWYQPGVGRFTQGDPFPGVLALPLTQNPYVYGLNSPTNLTDPTGKTPLGLALGAGLIAATIRAAFSYAQYAPGHSMAQTLELVWQCDRGAIANVFVAAAVSTLLYSLMPWSAYSIGARLVWGAVIGGFTSIMGDMLGRAVEYWITGQVPLGTYDWKTYKRDWRWGIGFGLFGQVMGVFADGAFSQASQVANSKWFNQNPYLIRSTQIESIKFTPWRTDSETGERVMFYLLDAEGPPLLRGIQPENMRPGIATANLYNIALQRANTLLKMGNGFKFVSDWLCNSTAISIIPIELNR